MRDRGTWVRPTMWAALAAGGLIAGLELLTNSLDTQRFSWDFRYYIAMAQHGLATPMASPFAYRFATPLLAGLISRLLHGPVESGFRAVSYLGAFLQLVSIFLFVRWFTRSVKGAWVAMLVTALSLFNVKFLMFDIYRPDHLAYALIVLQSYFALKRRFFPLLVLTVVGCQIREFNVIPLIAYMYSSARHPMENGDARPRLLLVEALTSGVVVGTALLLPRLLIPVAEDFQFTSLSRDGILRPVLAPFILERDANYAFSIIAYLLPILMLGSVRQLAAVLRAMEAPDRAYLVAYGVLVAAFSFLGGTDFYRFSTYLLVPQGVLLGLLADRLRPGRIMLVLGSLAVFNRIWLPFPMADVGSYLDFYGGFGTRLGPLTIARYLECLGFLVVGLLVRRLIPGDGLRAASTAP